MITIALFLLLLVNVICVIGGILTGGKVWPLNLFCAGLMIYALVHVNGQ